MKKSFLMKILVIVSFLAILVSGYLLYLHYTPDIIEFCEIGGFSCHTVNKSVYSNLDGVINHFLGTSFNLPISNALISLIVFIFIFLGNLFLYKGKRFLNLPRKEALKLIEILLFISLIYGILLIYIQAKILLTWCIFCLVLDALILLAFIIAIFIGGDS
ncbi:MAG: hypothetical protein CMH64_02070 [Nanoarchaeota archaeon]|nr:hypothetical protein [Nanoarchaeota archaeon]|tara:strand:- start:1074 stop:1553 length:480 start_codon:yes stop_codon:yes gene_type:complete